MLPIVLDPEQMASKPITIVGDDPRVDVLTVAWTGGFEDAWPRRIVRRIDGVRVPYLSKRDLIASKQTDRPSDIADTERLAGPARRTARKTARRRRA